MPARFSTTAYRYPYEYIILGLTILLVMVIIAFTAAATVCGSVIFIPIVVFIGYLSSQRNHQALVAQSTMVTAQTAPEVISLAEVNSARLQVEPVNIFIVPSSRLNAYTFGMSSPKTIVLYSSLFKIMDQDEIQFILGHEMGHVRLGHTWLNTLVGGMAGIPSSTSAGIIMELAFRWWNRACEYSADRAGVLACGQPAKAVTALIKLEAGPSARSQAGMQAAIQHIDAEDDDIASNLAELMASHPMIIKRIDQIREYVRSSQYRDIQAKMDQNLNV